MNRYPDPLRHVLDDLRHAGGIVADAHELHRNGLFAVQFGLEKGRGDTHIPRYIALGSPRLVAAAEYYARAMAQGRLPTLDECLCDLGLPRQAAAEVLLVDEAAHAFANSTNRK